MDDGSSGDAVNRSVAQIELSAKPIGDFLGASLIPDQIARRGNNRWLKTEGVILAHNNLQIRDSDLPGDHLGELLCSDVFSNHGEIPRFNRPSRADREFLKDSSTNMVDHETVQICFDIAGHAAKRAPGGCRQQLLSDCRQPRAPDEPDPVQREDGYPIAKVSRHAIRQHRDCALLADVQIIPRNSVHLAPRFENPRSHDRLRKLKID